MHNSSKGCYVITNFHILWLLDYHSVIWIFYEEAIKYQSIHCLWSLCSENWKRRRSNWFLMALCQPALCNRSVLHISSFRYSYEPSVIQITIVIIIYPTPLWTMYSPAGERNYLPALFLIDTLLLYSQQGYYISKMIEYNIFGGK